jgi:hypothetical protein
MGDCNLTELKNHRKSVEDFFTENELLLIFKSLIVYVESLRKFSIYHGDIKPQNIVLVH